MSREEFTHTLQRPEGTVLQLLVSRRGVRRQAALTLEEWLH